MIVEATYLFILVARGSWSAEGAVVILLVHCSVHLASLPQRPCLRSLP